MLLVLLALPKLLRLEIGDSPPQKKISSNLSVFENDFSLNIVDYPEFLSTKRIKFLNYPPPPNPTPAFNLIICSLNAEKTRCKSVCW